MKYIRTKHNIFEVIEETDLVYRVIGASRKRNNIYSKSKCNTEAVKSADTIEELIDEKIIIDANKKHIIVKTELEEIWWKQHDKDFVKCYAAIWIEGDNNEPILKSIAKVNNEGKLELI